MRITDKIAGWYDSRKEKVQMRILYGLKYSGLTMKWWSLRCYMMLLDIVKRKLQKMHINSISTANGIWGERERLGETEEDTTNDQLCSVKELDPDKVEEFVEVDEALVVGETLYEEEIDRPSEHTNVC